MDAAGAGGCLKADDLFASAGDRLVTAIPGSRTFDLLSGCQTNMLTLVQTRGAVKGYGEMGWRLWSG
jgi:hypothetical protein